jgi:Transglutaminase-like superfamily
MRNSFSKARRRTELVDLCLAMVLAAGCQQAAPIPAVSTTTQPAAAGIDFAEPPADDLDGGQLIEEVWDAYSMQGTRVGYARTTVAQIAEHGRPLIRTSNYTRTEMQRGGQTVVQDLILTSWDTPAGEFVRFHSRMSAGTGEIVAVGSVRDGHLGIDISTLGRTESVKLLWQPEWGGLFAPDQSLRKSPLQQGESRTVRSLLPIFNIPADTSLTAAGEEMVELPGGARKLLKITSRVAIGAQTIETLLWLNEQGETLKSLVAGIGQEAVRTTKADALRRSAGGAYDLLAASAVPLTGALPNPASTQRVVYRARLKEGAIAGLFADCPAQQIKLVDHQTAEITVVAVRPKAAGNHSSPAARPAAGPIAPVAADLASNNFIQSDDLQITTLASRIAPGEVDPWKLACALEKFVDQTIQLKGFSQAFATAAEVCRTLEGDCTEHAVLLAALCRARQIPARVAFGLVYYPPEQGFAYHMWNEVWIADRWVPLDATLGQGGIGADHIKLGDSHLAGGSPLADLLAVIQVFGRLELAVVSAE